MSAKLTPWFDGSVKPVYRGVYERNFGIGVRFYCRWTGQRWCRAERTPWRATAMQTESMVASLPWRGLAQKPAKKVKGK